MNPKNYLYLFIGIAVALAAYLYTVKEQRKQSIADYFDQPKVGDIYKIEEVDDKGDPWVSYQKVLQVDDRGLVFAPGKFKANQSSDYLLKHFNELTPFGYTRDELNDLKNGKWDNYEHNNMKLIEIIRKK
jgi:hypothetical protein